MKVPPTSPHRYAVNGSEVVFCSERCRDRFASNPSKYQEGHEARAEGSGDDAQALRAVAFDRPGDVRGRDHHPGRAPHIGRLGLAGASTEQVGDDP